MHKGIRVLPVYTGDGMGAYLTKVGEDEGATPGPELARADLKAARGASRSLFRILEDHLRRDDVADWRLFSEWLVVSRGRRTLESSRGLRALLLADVEEDRRGDRLVARVPRSTSPRSRLTCDASWCAGARGQAACGARPNPFVKGTAAAQVGEAMAAQPAERR